MPHVIQLKSLDLLKGMKMRHKKQLEDAQKANEYLHVEIMIKKDECDMWRNKYLELENRRIQVATLMTMAARVHNGKGELVFSDDDDTWAYKEINEEAET